MLIVWSQATTPRLTPVDKYVIGYLNFAIYIIGSIVEDCRVGLTSLSRLFPLEIDRVGLSN
jgi:hypothetical protein